MSIHHGRNAKASRRERRRALRDARWLREARQGRWPHQDRNVYSALHVKPSPCIKRMLIRIWWKIEALFRERA